jgi:hypothetical protein
MDNDIEHIYVDGLTNIVDNLDKKSADFNGQLSELTSRLIDLSEHSSAHFTVSINCDKETLPEEIKALMI